jgi:hypothetical protein
MKEISLNNIHDHVQTFNNSMYGINQPNITSPIAFRSSWQCMEVNLKH